jgi:3-oxoacyl-[acyl-carrier protein] reductase
MASPREPPAAGHVAIVTGGSRGIGRATVDRLASRGYAVVVNYLHDQRAAEATVDAVLADRGAAVAVRADASDDLDVQRLFAETIEAFGGVDAVVHTVAGRITSSPVAETALDELDALCRLNTRATLIVDREAARLVRTGGAIVNLSSSAAGSATPVHGVYAATRAATDVLTRVLALELGARDITVNAVALPTGGPCRPHRIADAVAYLLSAEGHGLTGQVIRLDEREPLGPPPAPR